MQVEDEAGALGELRIDFEVAVHLQGHLLTDGQTQSVAFGEVVDLKEGLEYVLTSFFCDAATRVRHQELVRMRPALLELQVDVATLGRVLCGISQKVL